MIDALLPLLLAVIGLPVLVGSLALAARHLVYKHADQEAARIRDAVEAARLRRALAEAEDVASR